MSAGRLFMSERLRKACFWLHLGLGLAAGLFFLVMCGTGVVLAYRPQLELVLNHWGLASHYPAPGAPPLPLETLLERVRAKAGATPQSVTVYPGSRATVDIYLGRRAGTVYADACTGAILGHPSPAVFGFFAQTMSWHTALGLPGASHWGRTLLDAANLAGVLVLLLGFCLWLPRQWTWRHWQAGLLPRARLAGRARDFNWHNVMGFWTLVPLLVMMWSGVALSYRWADRVTLQTFALLPSAAPAPAGTPVVGFNDAEAVPDPFSARIAGLQVLVDKARARVAGWGSISFEVPEFLTAPVSFAIDPNGCGLAKGGQVYRLQLDRSGTELSFQPPSPMRGRGIYRFAHTGELWGAGGQTVALLGCLGGVILVGTGFSLSWRRFRPGRGRAAGDSGHSPCA